jgi:hypothetical protein
VRSYKALSLELIIRASDVSNCAKPFGVSKQWFNRMTAEFFQQGMGLTRPPPSPLPLVVPSLCLPRVQSVHCL